MSALIFRLLILTLISAISLVSSAALPPKHQSLERILAEKGEAKFSEIKTLGPNVYRDLQRLTFSSEQPLGLRWEAFMAMVRLGDRESIPEINKALNSGEWFLKDAALKVLPAVDKDLAYKAALIKLNDSALVVRTSAVDVLGQVKNPKCAEKLWSQLYSKENYMKHQSLWIRRHIVEALADLAPKGSEDKFVKVLDDSDSTLFAPAIKGLERLTGKKLGDPTLPPVYKRYFWKKWYGEKIGKT